ncbi:MAG: hypothetical protein JW739_01845 [Opitutales bacterium]|nr:hypothetical protein [Opitutales bacterium]
MNDSLVRMLYDFLVQVSVALALWVLLELCYLQLQLSSLLQQWVSALWALLGLLMILRGFLYRRRLRRRLHTETSPIHNYKLPVYLTRSVSKSYGCGNRCHIYGSCLFMAAVFSFNLAHCQDCPLLLAVCFKVILVGVLFLAVQWCKLMLES